MCSLLISASLLSGCRSGCCQDATVLSQQGSSATGSEDKMMEEERPNRFPLSSCNREDTVTLAVTDAPAGHIPWSQSGTKGQILCDPLV